MHQPAPPKTSSSFESLQQKLAGLRNKAAGLTGIRSARSDNPVIVAGQLPPFESSQDSGSEQDITYNGLSKLAKINVNCKLKRQRVSDPGFNPM